MTYREPSPARLCAQVTGGFGAGSELQITLRVAGMQAATDICQGARCVYRLYGGMTYNTPLSCCATDFFTVE